MLQSLHNGASPEEALGETSLPSEHEQNHEDEGLPPPVEDNAFNPDKIHYLVQMTLNAAGAAEATDVEMAVLCGIVMARALENAEDPQAAAVEFFKEGFDYWKQQPEDNPDAGGEGEPTG